MSASENQATSDQAKGPASTEQHGQTYMGGQFGQFTGTELNKKYSQDGVPMVSKQTPAEGTFQIISAITVHENQPIDHSSRVFHATLHSSVTKDRQIIAKIIATGEKNQREAKIHFMVPHHKNIVERIATDIFNFRGQPSIYIAMELCDFNLYDYIMREVENEIPFDSEKYISIAHQIVTALDFLHSHKIIHRDLHPNNVLVMANGKLVKLSDFGLSKDISEGRDSTNVSLSRTGNVEWQAPEVWIGLVETSTATDIFPCGLVLHFVWSYGKHPFDKKLVGSGHLLVSCADIAESLLKLMLEDDPAKRPSTRDVLQSEVFDSQVPEMFKVSDSKLYLIVNDAIEKIRSHGMGNLTVNDDDGRKITQLGVTTEQMSNAIKLGLEIKNLFLIDKIQVTYKQLHEIFDDVFDCMIGQSKFGYEKTPLGFTVNQVAKILENVYKKNEMQLSAKRTIDEDLDEVFTRALDQFEAKQKRLKNYKTAFGFNHGDLVRSLKRVCEKKRMHFSCIKEPETPEPPVKRKATKTPRISNERNLQQPVQIYRSSYTIRIRKNEILDQYHKNPAPRLNFDVVLLSDFEGDREHLTDLCDEIQGSGYQVQNKRQFMCCHDWPNPEPIQEGLLEMSSKEFGITTIIVAYWHTAFLVDEALDVDNFKTFLKKKRLSGESMQKHLKTISSNLAVFTLGSRFQISKDLAKIAINISLISDENYGHEKLQTLEWRGKEVHKVTFLGKHRSLEDFIENMKAMTFIKHEAVSPSSFPSSTTESVKKVYKTPYGQAFSGSPLCRRGCDIILMTCEKEDKKFLPQLMSQIFGTSSHVGKAEFICCAEPSSHEIIEERISKVPVCVDGVSTIIFTYWSTIALLERSLDLQNFGKNKQRDAVEKLQAIQKNLAVFAILPSHRAKGNMAKIDVNIRLDSGPCNPGKLQTESFGEAPTISFLGRHFEVNYIEDFMNNLAAFQFINYAVRRSEGNIEYCRCFWKNLYS